MDEQKAGETKQKVRSKDLLNLVESQHYRCAMTGRILEPNTASVDHIYPVSRGGSFGIENLQIVHAQVNTAKGTMTTQEFVAVCREVVAWVDGHGYSHGCMKQ